MTKTPPEKTDIFDSRAGKFFWAITTRRGVVLFVSFALIAVSAAFIPTLERDTRAESFIEPSNPALIYRDKVKETFGLRDPVVVAVINEGPNGVFNPKTLELVSWITDEISNLEGVDPDRITSLATEKDIFGTDFGMEIELFFEYPPETQEEADVVREKVMDFPLYLGSLVAEDGTGTLIVAELLDDSAQARNYQAFMDLVDRAPTENGEVLYVAGEGAIREYMGIYIDKDAFRLNPVAGLVIFLILIVAFRTVRGAVLPNLVVLGAIAATMGSMAGSGVAFFVITNALPVIVIAICTADAIHILSQYYEELAQHPDDSQQQLIVRAMVHMWRPVTFTSLTDIAGFTGLSIASSMPPMRYFGIFASVGVAAALFFSVFTIPAVLALLKKKQSAPFRNFRRGENASGDIFSRIMGAMGAAVIPRPKLVLAVVAIVTIAGLVGAVRLRVNEDRRSVFQPTEPIILADNAINKAFDGTNYLDIVIETPEVEGLFDPQRLERIEALQKYIETLPYVGGTTSIVDYLKQMNRAVNEDRSDHYVLPAESDLVAQYFLLYSASGDPTDFEEEIDYDYRLANVRASVKTGEYERVKEVVEPAQAYLDEHFNADGIEANLSGGVNLDYHWIGAIGPNHFYGVVLALIGVWLMAAISFRSAVAGIFAAIPVCFALLAIYAVMGFMDIWLGVGTTMFAAIAVGVSVDFAIHTIDRLIALVKEQGKSLDEALRLLYPSTGRALFFSFLAMALGFGVLLTSYVPVLNRFGGLVAVATTISFISSMTLLPALIKLTQPKFLGLRETDALESVDAQLGTAK